MSPLLLRAFVNERLAAAVDEIFNVFERTVAKYEEEANNSKREIERLRGQLQEWMSKHTTGVTVSSVCREQIATEQHHTQHKNPELCHIKEENDEFWTNKQQEGQVREALDAFHLSPRFVWEANEQEDTKPVASPQAESLTPRDECVERQEDEAEHLPLSADLTPFSHSEQVQDGGEDERPPVCQTDKTQTEHGQTSLLITTKLSEPSHMNSLSDGYQCFSCTKSFASYQLLIGHVYQFHPQDANNPGAICGKTFESCESLEVQLKTHNSSRSCHICGKGYRSITALTEHMAGHSGVKLHRCHVCGKECTRKGDLKIHMRIHTGEKPFCCTFCSKSFTHSGHLKKHLRSHTGERPHRCEICGRRFLQSTHLKYHLGTHNLKY